MKRTVNTYCKIIIIIILFVISLCRCLLLPFPENITKDRIGLKLEKSRYPDVFEGLISMNEYLPIVIGLRNILVNNREVRRLMSDINLDYGFFLAQVYLRKTLRDNEHMDTEIANYIYYLISDFQKQRQYNNVKVIEDTDSFILDTVGYSAMQLIVDEEYWIESIQKQSVVSLNPFAINDTDGIFVDWTRYKNLVENSLHKKSMNIKDSATKTDNNWKPLFGPESDVGEDMLLFHACLQFVLDYYSHDENLKQRRDPETYPPCVSLNDSCLHMIEKGKYWGLEQSLRLQYLLTAKFGFRCTVFSPERDNELLNEICIYSFNEGHFSSLFTEGNNTPLLILHADQIAYCLMEGHALFLQKKWIKRFLELQTQFGCFDYDLNKKMDVQLKDLNPNTPWFQQYYNRFLYAKDACDSLLTGAIAPVLAASLRFLLETYNT